MKARQVYRITLAVISFLDYKHLSSFLKHLHIDIVKGLATVGTVSEEVRAVSRECPVGAPRRRLQIQRSQGVGETVP